MIEHNPISHTDIFSGDGPTPTHYLSHLLLKFTNLSILNNNTLSALRPHTKFPEMEGEAAKRRINLISGHFVSSNDDSSSTHLLPMNCSSSLNSVIRRSDNRTCFARQGSGSQGYFMRLGSTEEFFKVSSAQSEEPPKSSDSTNGDRCNASEMPLFARPLKVQPDLVAQRHYTNDGYYSAAEVPMFSRPAKIVNLGVTAHVSSPDPPKFARPNKQASGLKQFSLGYDGSPRMNVAESGRDYVMTVEIPGVDGNDIRVEVNDQHLTVTGKGTSKCWTTRDNKYHKGILQGPYRVVWPLPSDAHKDIVSAEFCDGFLQIVIPKL